MRSFDQFLAVLNEIPDPRRAEGITDADGLRDPNVTGESSAS